MCPNVFFHSVILISQMQLFWGIFYFSYISGRFKPETRAEETIFKSFFMQKCQKNHYFTVSFLYYVIVNSIYIDVWTVGRTKQQFDDITLSSGKCVGHFSLFPDLIDHTCAPKQINSKSKQVGISVQLWEDGTIVLCCLQIRSAWECSDVAKR